MPGRNPVLSWPFGQVLDGLGSAIWVISSVGARAHPMPTDPLVALSDTLSSLVAKTAQSVVAIQSRRTRASGFVWRPNLIVTNEETLADDEEISVVLPGGEYVAAHLAGQDPSTAIALLRLDRDVAPQLALTQTPVPPGALALAVGALG